MSILLADIDATCAALGYSDGDKYQAEPDAIQGLKHLIWILRRDLDNHEYRRHLGRSKVLQTDLIYMLPDYIDDAEFSDVLIRLLVILTSPTLLLYRDGPPKDNHGRKVYLELIDILQIYKNAFTRDKIWSALFGTLKKTLAIDWAVRSEEQSLLIERILVLIRNVLQVPANPEAEGRADNDASLHDQVIWALHQSGILDLILFIISSPDENQFHLHGLEILCLLFREQTAESLADASLQRSHSEKQRDEQELIAARRREKTRLMSKPPPGRHSRFGGTYVIRNLKSVSDRDIICHQPLERVVSIDFDREKKKQKRSFRHIGEEAQVTRRSAFSVRLCLREYCIEVLRSAYNTLVRQVRRVLERNSGSTNHDDSYLLWAIRFFMEFNRLSGLKLELVSESLSVQCFHWVLTRMNHDMDMIVSDKKQARLWAKRLHVALQTFRELLYSLIALQKIQDDNAQGLFDMLLNNVCYVLEYRETILHLLMNYNETHSTKAFLRDAVETANIFFKMMEKFCKDSVMVQDKKRTKSKSKNKKSAPKKVILTEEELFDKWAKMAGEMSCILSTELQIPEEDRPLPFDATSDKTIDDQKEDCMVRIHKLLRDEQMESAVALLRAAREVWPEKDVFGSMSAAPEDELLLLREIFLSNFPGSDEPKQSVESEEESENEEYEEQEDNMVEKAFKFDDFAKRLLNPKIVRACTHVLMDWENIPTKSLKAAVTILHRIAVGCSCPGMLYQAKLFRIFQQVLNAVRDVHHEELRRLGIYVIRKFVEIAPANPKIFAELLFYKSIKEANELEFGYCDAYESGTKGTWTEEQENELRFLFEENQRNPETDKDVIDWIMENLNDKTRTRRGILKKLKELGLQFKAPTKKSAASANQKNLWRSEEDEELRSLYDQHRTEDDCLKRILDEFEDRRTKQQIIKRMLQLHMIADKSEILPQKPRKRKNKKKQNQSDDENNEDDGFMEEPIFGEEDSRHQVSFGQNKTNRNVKKNSKPMKRKIVRTPLDVGTIKCLIDQIDTETYKVGLDWLKECLEDAADDEDEAAEEEDGVPLVPLLENQKKAMEDSNFTKLLVALGIQPPIVGVETYWRIPTYLNSADLQLRAKIIAGEEVEIDDDLEEDGDEIDNEIGDHSIGEESEEDFFDARQKVMDDYKNNIKKKMNILMFSKSDEESEERLPLKEKKVTKSKNRKKKESYKISEENEENSEDEIKRIQNKLNRKKKNYDLSSGSEEEFGDTKENLNNQKQSKSLKDSDGSPSNVEGLFDQLKAKRATKSKRSVEVVNQTAFDEDEANNSQVLDDFNFNSEDYRKRLLELEADSENDKDDNDDAALEKNRKRRSNVIDSESDDSNDGFITNKTSNKTSADSIEQVEGEGKEKILLGMENVGGTLGHDTIKADNNIDEADEESVKINASNNISSNKKRSRRLLNESDGEDDNENDTNDVRNDSEMVADNDITQNDNEYSKAKKEKVLNGGAAVEEAKNEDDDDELFLSRRIPTKEEKLLKANGEGPAKRRRIAIIDDDDEEDY